MTNLQSSSLSTTPVEKTSWLKGDAAQKILAFAGLIAMFIITQLIGLFVISLGGGSDKEQLQ